MGDGRVLTRSVVVRMDEVMYDELERDALANSRTVSQTIRHILRRPVAEALRAEMGSGGFVRVSDPYRWCPLHHDFVMSDMGNGDESLRCSFGFDVGTPEDGCPLEVIYIHPRVHPHSSGLPKQGDTE